MSQPATEAPPPPKKGGSKKVLGLPPPVVLGGGAALLTLAYLWYRSHKAKAAGAAGATSSTTSSTAQNVDTSQLAAELEQLLAEQGGGGFGGGGSGAGSFGGGTTTATGTGGGTTTRTTAKTSTGTGSKTTAKTTTKTTTPPPAPSGGSGSFSNPPFNTVGVNTIHVTPSANGVSVSWGPLSHATSYKVRIEHGTTLIHGGETNGTSQQISGLMPHTNYRVRIAGVNNAGAGAWSAPVYFNTA
jgi:hypothetical protein